MGPGSMSMPLSHLLAGGTPHSNGGAKPTLANGRAVILMGRSVAPWRALPSFASRRHV